MNLNYTEIAGKQYSRVSLGSVNSWIQINPDFKFILIATELEAKTFDAPLLNRFEKHLFTFSNFENYTNKNKKLLNLLNDWFDKLIADDIFISTENDYLYSITNIETDPKK